MKILKTAEFQKWFKKLSFTVRALITKRLLRVESGNLGDFKPVGDGVLSFVFIPARDTASILGTVEM